MHRLSWLPLIYQSDEVFPNRLLGVCLECQAWLLIDASANIMVHLPDEEAPRNHKWR